LALAMVVHFRFPKLLESNVPNDLNGHVNRFLHDQFGHSD
jgi:hypothetical protein